MNVSAGTKALCESGKTNRLILPLLMEVPTPRPLSIGTLLRDTIHFTLLERTATPALMLACSSYPPLEFRLDSFVRVLNYLQSVERVREKLLDCQNRGFAKSPKGYID
jgi:hypothetical protein